MGGVAALALLVGCGDGAGSGTPEDRGRRVASARGCVGCHSTDGSSRAGPTWKGLAGSEVELDDGTTVVADRAYLVRAVQEPGADVVDGYGATMPDLGVPDDDIDALVAYIESLR